MFKFKIKKTKGNAILATFIFAISFFMLCAFGTDTAYIILTRYKLQKITEAIAIEYCSIKAKEIQNIAETDAQRNIDCQNVIGKYERIYQIPGTGLLGFHVEDMRHKVNMEANNVVVRVNTTSRVLPTFLRFVGAREIVIHSTACAQTETIQMNGIIRRDNDFTTPDNIPAFLNNLRTNGYENANTGTTMVEFAPINKITAKNIGLNDFSINFQYAENANWNRNGGFYVFAGHEMENNNIGWVDIGNLVTNPGLEPQRVCPGGINTEPCFYCINAPFDASVNFNLTRPIEEDRDTGGRITRMTRLRIYKAAGGEDGNPCNPNPVRIPGGPYSNRDATVTLTILNNIKLITNNEFNNFNNNANNITEFICRP